MFVLIRQRGSFEKIIFEDADFNACVDKRKQKMVGADPSDEFIIYRKQDYQERLNEQQERANRYNEWNKKRKQNGRQRKASVKRTQHQSAR